LRLRPRRKRRKIDHEYIRSITGIVALLALSVVAGAQTIPDNVGKSSSGLPAQLQNVGFAPQLNAQLPSI